MLTGDGLDYMSRRAYSMARRQENSIAVRVANRRRGLLDNCTEEALISDLEVLSLDTGGDQPGTVDRDPLSYREAMEAPDAEKWKIATHEEWDAVLRNGTFQSFEEVAVTPYPADQRSATLGLTPLAAPGDQKVIGWKWVYKRNVNPDGTTRYKVRLVIRGFEQVVGTDFGEMYSPVSKLTTFRFLVSLAASYGWDIDHMDVATAFLNPKIDREAVFISLPSGME